jgi:hypothetical protein
VVPGGGVRACEMAAFGPGKKTTERGSHVSEGGEGKAEWDDVGERGVGHG